MQSDAVLGSNTEGSVSHVLSSRMNSRPMGWSREGADSLSRLRIYWINRGNMLDLVRSGNEAGLEKPAEEVCLSVAELLLGKEVSLNQWKIYRSLKDKGKPADICKRVFQ